MNSTVPALTSWLGKPKGFGHLVLGALVAEHAAVGAANVLKVPGPAAEVGVLPVKEEEEKEEELGVLPVVVAASLGGHHASAVGELGAGEAQLPGEQEVSPGKSTLSACLCFTCF